MKKILDTVRIKSPVLSALVANKIKKTLIQKTATNMLTGENLYSIISGEYEGSYSNHILCRVNSDNSMVIEGSVHKAKCGHNVFDGPESLKDSIFMLISIVNRELGTKLPSYKRWEILRIDVAHTFDLGSQNAVLEYLSWLTMAKYPRRTPTVYHGCVYWPGKRFTIKFYSKGLEYKHHDKKKIQKNFGDITAQQIGQRADPLLRVEVEIRHRELIECFGGNMIKDITIEKLNSYWQKKVEKVLGERIGDKNMLLVVSESAKVKERLYGMYSARMARSLYSTWSNLSKHGLKVVETEMSKTTLHYHKKKLINAGISWMNTDVILSDHPRLVPSDFVPSLTDIRRAS